MDLVGLIALREELADDCRILSAAAVRVENFAGCLHAGALEAAAFEIARCYNVIEQAALRVARSFENHFEENRGWHEALLKGISLEIPGVRPALFPTSLKQELDAIQRFRHLIHHAYDLELRRDRVEDVARTTTAVISQLEVVWADFIERVAHANGWQLPR